MSAGGVAVAVDDLRVSFGARLVLEDISFSLPRGTFVGILGPNGAGKTTLLRALLGDVAVAGHVELERPVAYVPQLTEVQAAFPIDALGVVLMGCYPRLGWWRRPGRRERDHARALLDRVGLADRARSPFDELSGGQRQRVLLARALAQEGRVMLLDEPLSGIDVRSRELMLEVVSEQARDGAAVLMTTHDLAEAARVCDRMLILNRSLVAEGATQDIFTEDVLRRAYGAGALLLDGRTVVLDDPHHHHHVPAERLPWTG
ncbi:MAG: metal ABC transporter ATP-binding protein [Solirubrobacteraceae bacterium MAG38_C4-C5]|nr:metal ABC transporter ATP-binding protein [Candidatus Siliceabacter maunaloa]